MDDDGECVCCSRDISNYPEILRRVVYYEKRRKRVKIRREEKIKNPNQDPPEPFSRATATGLTCCLYFMNRVVA